ncbi:hypothetical protein B0H10DRAFT_1985618, partial [Mycena sp. CBHHK59/15]
MCDNISQLQSSILLGLLSLIPSNAARYTGLGLTAVLAVIYFIHLKRPSTQLRRLEDAIQKTENAILSAKSQCARDHLSLTEDGLRLLEIKREASKIQCRTLETSSLTWKKYRLLSGGIAQC